jgi:cell division septum initiation protein DivIVA
MSDDDDQSFEVRVARRAPGGDVEALLQRVRDLIDAARPTPLSTQQVKVDRDELLDLLDQAIERLPEEVRAARWLVKDHDEFLARTQREADEILAAARARAERMVQRSEVMKAAETEARRVVEQARAEAGRRRNEVDDFCDKRLAQFETVLERTMAVVTAGRARLRGPVGGSGERPGRPVSEGEAAEEGGSPAPGSAVFDQDGV